MKVGDNDLLDIDSRLIDIDDGFDLATIDVSGIELAQRDTARMALQPRRFFEPPVPWPAEAARDGDIVSFGGWPLALRRDDPDNRGAEFNPYTVTDVPVISANLDRFRVRLSRQNTQYSFGRTRDDEDERDYDFRGLSGSPVLRRSSGRIELVGFVTQYLDRMTESGILVDSFVMTNAGFIQSDGTL